MDLKKLFINFAIVGLIVFGIFSFIVIAQNNNNVTYKITDDDVIGDSYDDLETKLNNAQTQTQSSLGNFTRIPPTQEFGEVDVGSVVGPVKTVKTITIGVWNTLIQLPLKVLGVDPVVTNVLGAILIVLIIIGIWALYKGAIS